MKYDFTSILDRRGRDAIAVDGLKGDGFSPAPPKAGFDAIPMWVADMNFPTVPTIQEAIIERAKHPASKPEGTYMLFVDCTDWCAAHGKTIDDVEKACWEVGAAVQDGKMFHGPCHLRMNLASPRSRIEEAFRRMDQYVFHA